MKLSLFLTAAVLAVPGLAAVAMPRGSADSASLIARVQPSSESPTAPIQQQPSSSETIQSLSQDDPFDKVLCAFKKLAGAYKALEDAFASTDGLRNISSSSVESSETATTQIAPESVVAPASQEPETAGTQLVSENDKFDEILCAFKQLAGGYKALVKAFADTDGLRNVSDASSGETAKINDRLDTVAGTDVAAVSPKAMFRRSDTPFGIKKGLAYSQGAVTSAFSQDGSATWAYNWGTGRAPKFQQIPMMWGPGGKGDAQNVMELVTGEAKAPWVLGYNEPDVPVGDLGGCGTSAKDAYDAWGKDMFPFYQAGAKLVCPAVSSWNSTTGWLGNAGIMWLREFVSYTTKPTDLLCEAQALHWYGPPGGLNGVAQANLFIKYIEQAHYDLNDLFGFDMPIWVTEFAPLPLADAQVMAEFLDVAQPWLDAQDYVHRYSPFMADFMVTQVGQAEELNIAGQHFVSSKPNQGAGNA